MPAAHAPAASHAPSTCVTIVAGKPKQPCVSVQSESAMHSSPAEHSDDARQPRGAHVAGP